MYSIMNEWSQIVGQWAVGDTSFEQYESGLKDVLKQYEELGYQVTVHLRKTLWLADSIELVPIESDASDGRHFWMH